MDRDARSQDHDLREPRPLVVGAWNLVATRGDNDIQ